MRISFGKGGEEVKIIERSRARGGSLGEGEEVSGSLVSMRERKAAVLYIASSAASEVGRKSLCF